MTQIITVLIDVRDEADYNLFGIRDARNVQKDDLDSVVEEFMPCRRMPSRWR